MVGDKVTKVVIKKWRLIFWIAWSLVVTMPASVLAYLFDLSWWASPVIVIVSTIVGVNTFEWWLKIQKDKSTHTIVLCACGHEREDHKDDKQCLHVSLYGGHPFLRRDCVCAWYAPRFWQMSRRS